MNSNEKRVDFFYRVCLTVCDCREDNIYLMPFSFKRSTQEQKAVFESGKSLTLRSKHTRWLAIDVVVIINGEPEWMHIREYDKLAEHAKKNGLFVDDPGGRLDDMYHLEYEE
jgi:hypothetical protein